MATLKITEAEILDALAVAAHGNAPEDARTAQDMAADAGIDVRRVRVALQRLAADGRLVVHRIRRADLAGRVNWLPAYTILPAKKSAKR